MNSKTQKHCLTGLAAGFLVATAATVHWATLGSISESGDDASDMDQSRSLPAGKLTLDDSDSPAFDAGLASRALRRPLVDKPKPASVSSRPKPAPKPIAKPKQTLSLRLVGTIIDADERVAMISDSSGKVDIKGVGDRLDLKPDGVTIRSIESELVTIEYRGARSTIEIKSLGQSRPELKPSNRFRGGGRGR